MKSISIIGQKTQLIAIVDLRNWKISPPIQLEMPFTVTDTITPAYNAFLSIWVLLGIKLI